MEKTRVQDSEILSSCPNALCLAVGRGDCSGRVSKWILTELLMRAWEGHKRSLRGAGEGEEHLL